MCTRPIRATASWRTAADSIRARTACSSVDLSNGAATLATSAVAIAPSHQPRPRIRNANIYASMPQPDHESACGRWIADGAPTSIAACRFTAKVSLVRNVFVVAPPRVRLCCLRDSAGALQEYDLLRMAALGRLLNVCYFRFWPTVLIRRHTAGAGDPLGHHDPLLPVGIPKSRRSNCKKRTFGLRGGFRRWLR